MQNMGDVRNNRNPCVQSVQSTNLKTDQHAAIEVLERSSNSCTATSIYICGVGSWRR